MNYMLDDYINEYMQDHQNEIKLVSLSVVTEIMVET